MKNNDLRPAIICEDGKNIEITQCHIPETSEAQSVIRLENVNGAVISNNEVKGKANAFVLKEGNTKDVKMANNKIGDLKARVK
jgi:hypothetical protein